MIIYISDDSKRKLIKNKLIIYEYDKCKLTVVNLITHQIKEFI